MSFIDILSLALMFSVVLVLFKAIKLRMAKDSKWKVYAGGAVIIMLMIIVVAKFI